MLSIDGLISGLDTTRIIEELLALERRPMELAQGQVQLAQQRQTAFLDLSARLLALQSSARRLADPNTFRGVSVESSSPETLAASAAAGVPLGVYTFRVGQLASASQYTSGGFATPDETPVGAGVLSLELGGGFVDVSTELDVLNGERGVRRGSIRITDGSGATAVVDLSTAITVADVIAAINEASGISVTASVTGSGQPNAGRALTVQDDSGGAGNLVIEEVGQGATAADLGILGSGAGAIAGAAIRVLGRDSRLALLGDGLGVRTGAGNDLRITRKDGVQIDLDLDSGIATLGDLIDAVRDHSANADGKLTLAINTAGDGLEVTDTSGGSGDLIVADLGLGSAATDLGIAATSAGVTIVGAPIVAGIDDVLLATLNGGSGVAAGSIAIQDRAASTPVVIDLSGARTLQEVIRTINGSAAQVVAEINAAGNGLLIRDISGGSGDLQISEVGAGTTAADLGILAGPVAADSIDGSDLNPRYVHANTRLDALNGGRGVAAGSIRITDSNGVAFTVNLAQEQTIGDVIRDIEGAAATAGSDLTVGVNGNGNGLLLSSLTGSGTLRVDEVASTTARDLHIAGAAAAATPGVIDGAFEERITISATDTLEDVLGAIQALPSDIRATIINDGSAAAPHRLSLISGVSGAEGRLLVNATGGTQLGFQRTARARDGVLFFGESGPGSEPILIRSATNTYTDVIEGLTVSALAESSAPTQVSVHRNPQDLTSEVEGLVAAFNDLLGEIAALTDFNSETEERGILIGDATVRSLKRTVLRGLTQPLSGVSNAFTLLSEVGLRLRNDQVVFDRSAFESALETDPQALETLFGAARPLAEDTLLDDFNDGTGVSRITTGPEFRIHLRDGTDVDVDITGARTLHDVFAVIEAAGGGTVTAAISEGLDSIVLTDNTSGGDTFAVQALNSSRAASDLGIDGNAEGGAGIITGDPVDLSGDVGVAKRLIDAIESLVNPDTGVLQRRSDGFDEIIETIEKRIERMQERLDRREELLRMQFAQLEQIMAASQATMARLTASLSALGPGGGA